MAPRSPPPAPVPPKRLPKTWQSSVGHHKRLPFCFLDIQAEEARSRVLGSLSSDVSSALAEAIEELLTYGTEFRTALQRTWVHVLNRLSTRPEPLVFFHDCIPGFTALMFKKQDHGFWAAQLLPSHPGKVGKGVKAPEVLNGAEGEGLEEEAASLIIAQFVQRTGAKVRVVEGDDVICILFPVTDLKKNLREGGFYLVE